MESFCYKGCQHQDCKLIVNSAPGIFRVSWRWRPPWPHHLLWAVLLSCQAHRQRDAGGHQGGHDDQPLHHPHQSGHGCEPGGVLLQARLSSVRHLQWVLQEDKQHSLRLWLRWVRSGGLRSILEIKIFSFFSSGSPARKWQCENQQKVLQNNQGQEDWCWLCTACLGKVSGIESRAQLKSDPRNW